MRRTIGGLLVLGVALSAAAPAKAPHYAGLASIMPGHWQFREAEAPNTAHDMCVADPAMLLQLGHPGAHCGRRVLADEQGGTTVHYSCPGIGYGHTALTVETPRLIHIKTEGIAGGTPFDHDYEGRRVGECGH